MRAFIIMKARVGSLISLSFIFFLCCPLSAKVLLGIDVLEKENFEQLRGLRIGLITNHTGVDSEGRSDIDVLFHAQGVQLRALFSPEHGIRGIAPDGREVSDSRDERTGLPVFSLYGKTVRPTDEMLEGLDALVFDIQDIGTRYYTYITTLAYCLEEASKRNLKFFVLDRPNPITGTIVEGESLDPSIKHFTAYVEVPVRHGMTIGEIADLHNQATHLKTKLKVIKMEGWKREMWGERAGLFFRPTSPNIPTLRSALLYSGIGAFEATNVSVGRGTKTPFEIFGAPWINAKDFSDQLNFLALSGFAFKPVRFIPKSDLYKGKLCDGVKIIVKDRDSARPLDLFIHAFVTLRDLYPEKFVPRWDEVARVTGARTLKTMLDQNQSAEAILTIIHEKAAQFEKDRKHYLLYE